MQKPADTRTVRYHCAPISRQTKQRPSIEVIGIDTEAYDDGRCFMIATSEGDVWRADDWPHCIGSRKYRGVNFVAYNLKYDEGALIQHLPRKQLEQLRTVGKTLFENYHYHLIPGKCLTIRHNKHSVMVYDMYNFYRGSLEYNAEKYLGEHKDDIETKTFTREYVDEHWQRIADYCVKDADLVKRLAQLLISRFERFGVNPRKLYSTAYVSYQYFSRHTNYVTVQRFWDKHRYLLDYAMRSYNGGKFEVTEKRLDYLYEYDIISAYPNEIKNLIDIRKAQVLRSKTPPKSAVYGFIDVVGKIPVNVYSPVALKNGTLNVYPVGEIHKTITKTEYEYLLSQGADLTINDAVWLIVDKKEYPYREAIERLVKQKQEIKKDGDALEYHTIKIFLNSLYGKFVQLIEKEDHWQAGTSWNPIYGSIICANVRTRISELQQTYPEVIAVHTDSLISTKPLPFAKEGELGDVVYECEGDGLILGSGVYQIGEKVRMRGFDYRKKLTDYVGKECTSVQIDAVRPLSWREVVFRNLDLSQINRFTELPKQLNIRFDRKRIWIRDWKRFSDITDKPVLSMPLYNTLI